MKELWGQDGVHITCGMQFWSLSNVEVCMTLVERNNFTSHYMSLLKGGC